MDKNFLLENARSEIGYGEKAKKYYDSIGPSCLFPKTAYAGSDNYTKYSYDLTQSGVKGHPNGYAWCMTFICDLFRMTFSVDLANRLLCGMLGSPSTMEVKDAMLKAGRGVPLNEAQPGDIVFRSRNGGGHVGLVEGWKDGEIVTIEGNSSNSDKDSWNGGEVVRHVGATWMWCCRPDWSLIGWHWVKDGGIWYYQDATGKNSHGWKKIKETNGEFTHWYYFDSKGRMLTGAQMINGAWYFLMPNGSLEGALCQTDGNGELHIWNV